MFHATCRAYALGMVAYLDCAATTPMEPEVVQLMLKYMTEEFGNAGSRTHAFGLRAKKAVEFARRQVADVVRADPDEILFTSGATESNNLAILGLSPYAERTGRKHIVTTAIEHKAVLEPAAHLEQRGFEVTRVPPTRDGHVLADAVLAAVRSDTVLVSVMHANNETGILQPIEQIAAGLSAHEAYFHVDAAQTFGKLIPPLQNERVDLISLSGHKIYGPKGVGALVTRRRNYKRPPLEPLMFGGGQEKGLRPGTLPVALIAGLGCAARCAVEGESARAEAVRGKRQLIEKLASDAGLEVLCAAAAGLPHIIALQTPLDAEALLVATKDHLAASNGAACSSQRYEPSHVFRLLAADPERVLRLSLSHRTSSDEVIEAFLAIRRVLGAGV